MVAGFIRFRVVHSVAPRGRRVHSDSRACNRVRIGVAGFIRVRVGLLERA